MPTTTFSMAKTLAAAPAAHGGHVLYRIADFLSQGPFNVGSTPRITASFLLADWLSAVICQLAINKTQETQNYQACLQQCD